MIRASSGIRSDRRRVLLPGALVGLGALLAVIAVFSNRLWWATPSAPVDDALASCDLGTLSADTQVVSVGARLMHTLRCAAASADRLDRVRGQHAEHVLSAVHDEASVAAQLLALASRLAAELHSLAGAHENVLLRDQLALLTRSLNDSQTDYRRCLAAHSVESAGAVHRGYALHATPAPLSVRAKRKQSVLDWLPLHELVPLPLEPVDVVLVRRSAHTDQWLLVLQSLKRFGNNLRLGDVFVVGDTVAPLQEGDVLWGGVRVHAVPDSWPTILERVRDHFLLWEDSILLTRPAERSLFWDAHASSWGPRVRLGSIHGGGLGPCACPASDARLDALLQERALAPRPCIGWAPEPMCKAVAARVLSAGASVARQDTGSGVVDGVHLYAHWLLDHDVGGGVAHTSDIVVLDAQYAYYDAAQLLARPQLLPPFVRFANYGAATRALAAQMQ